jgi:hypothetical protein
VLHPIMSASPAASRIAPYRMLINRGRGYTNIRYLLLKARRIAVTNTKYVAFQKIRKAA